MGCEINRKMKEMSRLFPEQLEEWSYHSSKAMGGAGSGQKFLGHFKFQMSIRYSSATRYPVRQLNMSLNEFGLETHLRSQHLQDC